MPVIGMWVIGQHVLVPMRIMIVMLIVWCCC
ncbi:hypothetical protein GGD61_008324 [Bradyrhizobium sp. SBR1B]|nr:hypothetical protein [Bradyrhizobium sp. SBR1B]